jgi:hypothetical protein
MSELGATKTGSNGALATFHTPVVSPGLCLASDAALDTEFYFAASFAHFASDAWNGYDPCGESTDPSSEVSVGTICP